jgi:hypothetical protein
MNYGLQIKNYKLGLWITNSGFLIVQTTKSQPDSKLFILRVPCANL